MAEAATATFIKAEPEDGGDSNQYLMSRSGYDATTPMFGHHFGNNESVDPNDLTMQNGVFMSYPFGSQQNLSSNFTYNSGIDTSELLDLDLDGQNGLSRDGNLNYVPDQRMAGVPMSHLGQMTQVYSSTPEGGPIQSPFIRGSFNYEQFRPMDQQAVHTASTHSHVGGKVKQGYHGMDPGSADGKSPMTPKTPAMAGLTIGTPDSNGFPAQPIRAISLQSRHQKALSSHWDGTPGSSQSLIESPISSPGHPSHHHLGISEILKSGKHASLPTKVDSMHHGHHHHGLSAQESQDAKRKRRRASHNLVERRRRDNINERIQDLSHLVPQHRLEDDRVKKQLQNHSSLSTPGINSSNTATSLLSGGSGRRAAGSITMGLPIEEKEKGPNKGDILNGAVSWTRDLMWALYAKFQQEEQLAEVITSLGGTWPFEPTEAEKRMRTELLDAMEKNNPTTFLYSRGPGSGLRVPKHTNLAGDLIQGQQDVSSPQSLSPEFQSGGSGSNSGSTQPQFWNTPGHAGMNLKEEDEYSMEMN